MARYYFANLKSFLDSQPESLDDFVKQSGRQFSKASLSNACSSSKGVGIKTVKAIREFFSDSIDDLNFVPVREDEAHQLSELRNKGKRNKNSPLVAAVSEYLDREKQRGRREQTIRMSAWDEEGDVDGDLATVIHQLIDEEFKGRGGLAFILGDFGTGKTTFCQKFGYDHAEKWLQSQGNHYLPLIFSLSGFDPDVELEKWLFAELKRFEFKIEWKDFCNALENEELVLLLDGLDEITNRLEPRDAKRALDSFLNLQKRCPAISLVMTSRKDFFDSHIRNEMETELHVRFVGKLDPAQIAEFINRRTDTSDRELRKILKKKINEYAKLAERPLFLKLLIGLGKEIEGIQSVGDLYHSVTRETLKIQIKRVAQDLNLDSLLAVTREVAYWMFQNDCSTISLEQFMQISTTLDQAGANSAKVIHDDFLPDLFLRNSEDELRFAHPSFKDFFTAKKILADLRDGSTKPMENRLLYEEIYEFLSDLSWSRDRLGQFKKLLADPEADLIARTNCIPTIRKKLPQGALNREMLLGETDVDSIIQLLFQIHVDDREQSLLRYICGYTAEEFLKQLGRQRRVQVGRNLLVQDCTSRNTFVLICNEHLSKYALREIAYPAFADFEIRSQCARELFDIPGVAQAYLAVLTQGKERPCVVREAIRVMTAYCLSVKGPMENKAMEALKTFLLSDDLTSSQQGFEPEVRSIVVWAIYALGLNDQNSGHVSIAECKQANEVIDSLCMDTNDFVKMVSLQCKKKHEDQSRPS